MPLASMNVESARGRWRSRDGAWLVAVCGEPGLTAEPAYFQICHRGRVVANVRRLEELMRIVPLHELVEDVESA